MDRYAGGARPGWTDARPQRGRFDLARVRLGMSNLGRTGTLLAGGAVVLLCGALLLPSLRAPVSEMDEGAVLAYGQLVNDGEVPGRDFETFYGPGEPWLAAAAFDVADPSVGVERALGFAARLILLTALFTIAIRWGFLPAAAATATSALVMYPVGIGAFAFWSGVALAVLGLALLIRSLGDSDGESESSAPHAPWLAAAAGVSSGLAILFYVATAPAVVLASIPLLVRATRSARSAYLAGFLGGLIPTAVWAAVVGPHGISRLAGDLSSSRPGRHLPLPGLGTAEGQVLVASVLAVAGMLVAGAFLWRSVSRRGRGAILLSLGLFSLALLPQALERADTGHVVSLACVALPGIPLLLAEAIAARGSSTLSARRWLLGGTVALALLAVLSVAHISGSLFRDQALNRQSATHSVTVNGRSASIRSAAAAADLNALLPRLERISSPGDSLFVGPTDLRRTNYADTFVYFLMPELRPASFYTELNAGASNTSDSGLAEDLGTARFLLLTTRWDRWNEPNASSDIGSSAPSRVVAADFVPEAKSGSYVLYARRGP